MRLRVRRGFRAGNQFFQRSAVPVACELRLNWPAAKAALGKLKGLMVLETTLTDIAARLRQGRFSNEQAISQGIVLRLLQELGWDTWDTATIWPEYQTGEGRADFALCHPPGKPAIFIEVKQPGKAEDAVRQALEYAFHTGVPFIILTDGKTWSFYLPAEQGSYEDRRVYKLDLLERSPTGAAETLSRYLARERVVAGEALETARQEYRSRYRRSQARAAIPEVWHKLVQKGNEELVELLANNVELKTGIRPNADEVAEFLTMLGRPVIVETAHTNTTEASGRAAERRILQRGPS
jgi:predicted type IV restriction endonuclease